MNKKIGKNVTNNDILRRLRYCFNLKDHQLIATFASAEMLVAKEDVLNWLKKDDELGYINLPDHQLAAFLDGFIILRRGKREGEIRSPEKKLTNNIIINKLKIGLNLKAEDIISLLESIGFVLSKPELSAMFRKSDHKHYRECKDQILRNFLAALQNKFATKPEEKYIKPSSDENNSPKKPIKSDKITKRYDNPNITPKDAIKKTSERKTLKLKSSDIWEEHHK